MKTKLTIIILGFFFSVNLVLAQAGSECPVNSFSKSYVKTRGVNKNIKKNYAPGKQIMLASKAVKPKTRGKSCMISIYNYNKESMNVYVDSIYHGTVKANSIGVVEGIGSYSNVYCLSDDQSKQWFEMGSCKCTLVLHLKTEGENGEIKY